MIQARRKNTLAEKAYNEIKDALCQGVLKEGDLLSENQLAAQLEMSRTPVREALRVLEREGWVEIHNGIGAYVKPVSSKDIQDIYEVRCLLEIQAAQTAVFLFKDSEINDFTNRFQHLIEKMDSGEGVTLAEFSGLDWDFHSAIIDHCQNDYIKEIMKNGSSNMHRYQTLSAEVLNNYRESTLQHLSLLDAIRERDLELFTNRLKEHLNWASGLPAMYARKTV